MTNPFERYAIWMVEKGGAPSRFAAYQQLLLIIGITIALFVLLLTLKDQLR